MVENTSPQASVFYISRVFSNIQGFLATLNMFLKKGYIYICKEDVKKRLLPRKVVIHNMALRTQKTLLGSRKE